MATKNITVYRGDTHALTCIFEDRAGAKLDITGWKLYLTIKYSPDDLDADAVLSKTVTSHTFPLLGRSKITMTAAETNSLYGDYYYDIQYKKPAGTIQTALSGKMSFTKDETRSTA